MVDDTIETVTPDGGGIVNKICVDNENIVSNPEVQSAVELYEFLKLFIIRHADKFAVQIPENAPFMCVTAKINLPKADKEFADPRFDENVVEVTFWVQKQASFITGDEPNVAERIEVKHNKGKVIADIKIGVCDINYLPVSMDVLPNQLVGVGRAVLSTHEMVDISKNRGEPVLTALEAVELLKVCDREGEFREPSMKPSHLVKGQTMLYSEYLRRRDSRIRLTAGPEEKV